MTFLVTEIVRKKRDGGRLTPAEIAFLVKGFSDGSIPDYQAAAWLMATYLRGMTDEETVELTRAMKDSGVALKWRELDPGFAKERFADKHSTGGVGDKVSLILAPVAAELGVKVPMMSGRGLGHTGGTVDKLQSIPGFNMYPEPREMLKFLRDVGVAMMAQGENLCPADRKLYSLRDVTSTIESVPLITASIVSKKWAEGVDAIVFDVKVGDAAFMSGLPEARALGQSLCRAAELAGMRARACLTRMEEPLGSLVGNALEVEESLWILSEKYPSENHRRLCAPLRELSLRLACEMAVLSGRAENLDVAMKKAEESLRSGSALARFEKMVAAQGGSSDWREKIHARAKKFTYVAPRAGWIRRIHSREIGLAGLVFGVGRKRAEDPVDPRAGFESLVTTGDRVEAGTPLLHVYSDASNVLPRIQEFLDRAFEFDDQPVSSPAPLLLERFPA